MLSLPDLRAPQVAALMAAGPTMPGALVLTGILGRPENVDFLAGLVNPGNSQTPVPIASHTASGMLLSVPAPLQISARPPAQAPR